MRGKHTIFAGTGLATVLGTTLLLAAVPASAQSAGTWTLPEPNATPTGTRAQGPVDAQNPVVQAPSASSPQSAAPSPAPSSVPTIAAPPPPRVTPSAAPSAAARPTTRPTATPSTQPSAEATPRPAPSAAAATPAPGPSAEASPDIAVPATPAPAEAAPPADLAPAASESWPFWWWAAPAAAIALGALIVLLRRRRPEPEAAEAEWESPEIAEAPAAEELPTPVPTVPPAATAAPPPIIPPQPEFAAPPPSAAAPASTQAPNIGFEPLGLRLSLVYATLQFRLTLTAHEATPAGHLLGDMIGAHSSLSPDEQLAPAPETLTALKPLPALAAGETRAITAEVQLPLSAIRPLQRGSSSFFVPLLRLGLMFGEAAPALRRVYTVGLSGETALAPLRLDTGPMEHRDLSAREIEAARAYPLDGPRQKVAVG